MTNPPPGRNPDPPAAPAGPAGRRTGWPPPPPGRSGASLRGRLFFAWMLTLGGLYLVLVVALLAANLGYLDYGKLKQDIAAATGTAGPTGPGTPPARPETQPATQPATQADFALPPRATFDISAILYATKLSLMTSTATVLLALLIGLPAGYLLARHRFPGVVVIDTLLDIPIVLPPLVVGVSLLIFFNTPAGQWIDRHAWPLLDALNTLLMWLQTVLGWLLGLIGVDYEPVDMGSEGLVFSPWGIVLAQFIVACAFGIRMIKATFEQIDPRIEAVARTLGATRGQAFFRVSLPMARTGILAAAVVTWARAIGEFGPILIFCGTTRHRTEVLPTSIYLEFSVGNLQAALAVSMMMVGMAMAMLLIFKKLGGRF